MLKVAAVMPVLSETTKTVRSMTGLDMRGVVQGLPKTVQSGKININVTGLAAKGGFAQGSEGSGKAARLRFLEQTRFLFIYR